jgi:very-short-patch-repair endonuclease
VCKNYVNGRLVSHAQRRLCRRVGGRLNHRLGAYAIDIVIEIGGVRVAIEFDSWYWHAGREEEDVRRARILLDAGWRVLRIRTCGSLPTREQLKTALDRLVTLEAYVVLTLPGWGKGDTHRSRHRS